MTYNWFLFFTGILLYRGFRYYPKKTLKLGHAILFGFSFIIIVFGLIAVFDSHNLATTPIPNLYSMHSWLGLGTVILFCIQVNLISIKCYICFKNDFFFILVVSWIHIIHISTIKISNQREIYAVSYLYWINIIHISWCHSSHWII